MTALRYWDSTANSGSGAWVPFTLAQQNNVKISTSTPTDTSQLWVDTADNNPINYVDGGSA
jgi:hypothetical protein